MSKYKYILDNGHGGLINDVYQTEGKRSPAFPYGHTYQGKQVYEGVVNREIVNKLSKYLDELAIDYVNLVTEQEDTPLSVRVAKANDIVTKTKKPCIYISVHCNAFKEEWNLASGIETFFFHSSSTGEHLAKIFNKHIVKGSNFKDRGVKGSNFYVLRKTACPAVLTENGFMTNITEASSMMEESFHVKIAHAHVNAIQEIEKSGLAL